MFTALAHLLFVIISTFANGEEDMSQPDFNFEISMPSVQPGKADQYFCTSKKLDSDDAFIVGFEPRANASRAHHMILFGSDYPEDSSKTYPNYWDCGHQGLHKGVSIMYAWAKNAPPVSLPKNVGFHVGPNTSVRYLILQVHYATSLPDGVLDKSGLSLRLTQTRQKYTAGIFILANSHAVIPPKMPKFSVDVSCPYYGPRPMYTFAYRVHAHKLGVVVSGYKYGSKSKTFSLLGKGNPQWPQAFFPMENIQIIRENDIMLARCTYNSSSKNEITVMGSASSDEMCNLYLMYYTEVERGNKLSESSCGKNLNPSLAQSMPDGNDEPLPRNPLLEELTEDSQNVLESVILSSSLPSKINLTKKTNLHRNLIDSDREETQGDSQQEYDLNRDLTEPDFDKNYNYNEVSNWPKTSFPFGQVTAVTFDTQGNVVVFHRGSHIWNDHSFDWLDNYLPIDDGPVVEPTIITLDPVTGKVLHQWGEELFYLPHGLTIDKKGNAWVTDVALHQVFKFPEKGSKALVTIGERFKKGNDQSHFCKPASVAISQEGDIFVADGYCNTRIVRFSDDGKYISQFGESSIIARAKPAPVNTFSIPHKVILTSNEKLICVADRENGRIQCFTKVDGKFSFQIAREEFHGRLFSLASTEVAGGLIYAVCGNVIDKGDNHPVEAFVFNLTSRELLNIVTPKQGTFSQPHDIAVSTNADNVYVVEIGPDKIWKFERAAHKSTKKVLYVTTEELPITASEDFVRTGSSTPNPQMALSKPLTSSSVVIEASNFATSMVIMALLGIPVLLLILITVIFRLKKRGKFQHCSLPHVKGWLGGYRSPQEKFNIGSLLNPHKGFDRVALDESGDEKSDSDVEEFNAAIRKA